MHAEFGFNHVKYPIFLKKKIKSTFLILEYLVSLWLNVFVT